MRVSFAWPLMLLIGITLDESDAENFNYDAIVELFDSTLFYFEDGVMIHMFRICKLFLALFQFSSRIILTSLLLMLALMTL